MSGGPRQQFADLDRDAVAVDHHGALGDRQVVGEDIDRVVLGRVELDDGAAAEAQHLVDRHGRGAEHHRMSTAYLVECWHGRVPSGSRRRTHRQLTTVWLPRWLTRATIWTIGLVAPPGAPPVEWRVGDGLVPYEDAVAVMEARAAAIAAGREPELVWLVEHPPLYTAGTSARPARAARGALSRSIATGRGGQFTYHGPGQRVAYVMLDLKRRGPDVRRFVATLEEWIIRTLARFQRHGERREDRIGVWVRRPDKGPDARTRSPPSASA